MASLTPAEQRWLDERRTSQQRKKAGQRETPDANSIEFPAAKPLASCDARTQNLFLLVMKDFETLTSGKNDSIHRVPAGTLESVLEMGLWVWLLGFPNHADLQHELGCRFGRLADGVLNLLQFVETHEELSFIEQEQLTRWFQRGVAIVGRPNQVDIDLLLPVALPGSVLEMTPRPASMLSKHRETMISRHKLHSLPAASKAKDKSGPAAERGSEIRPRNVITRKQLKQWDPEGTNE